jgi:SHAQKYF class myb-like DNA-binding protein
MGKRLPQYQDERNRTCELVEPTNGKRSTHLPVRFLRRIAKNNKQTLEHFTSAWLNERLNQYDETNRVAFCKEMSVTTPPTATRTSPLPIFGTSAYNNLQKKPSPNKQKPTSPLQERGIFSHRQQGASPRRRPVSHKHSPPVPKVRPEKNSGKWSTEEHQQFLNGLEEFSPGHWSKIAERYVPTRTRQQTASHAQKYFKKAARRRKKIGHFYISVPLAKF